jgi:hypothetical protein
LLAPSKGPRSIGGSFRFGSPRASVSFGALGSRDYRLPVFMSTVLAGAEIPTPALSSLTDMSRGAMTWQGTASAKATVFTSKRGVTVGVAGDVFIPIGTETPQTPHNPVLSSRAIRFGVTFGF